MKLKVAEAIQDDVNKGIVRIDSSFMRELDVRPGNIVEIQGEIKTVAIVDRALPGDIGLNIIRMDGLTRRNGKTTIGEYVKVRKADVKEAKKITIAPANKGMYITKANPEIFKQGLLGRAVVKGDIVSLGGTRRRRSTMSGNPFFDDMFSVLDDTMGGFGLDLKFIIVDCQPKQAVLITEHTHLTYNPEAVELKEGSIFDVTYEDVGGLEDEVKKVREMIELPLKHPEVFERLGIEPPKGVLLHGSPGTGKTLLAKAVANETNANFILINGPEIMSKYYGQSEENLRKKFEDAEKNAPSIIFIDEIDAIASKREESKGEVERRVVAQLLALMDGLKSRGKVVVIAASNIPNSLDPALRRHGRFDREIEIGVPQKEGRLEILKIHTRNMPIKPDFDLKTALLKIKHRIFVLKRDVKELIAKQNGERYDAHINNKNSEVEILEATLGKLEKLSQKMFVEVMSGKQKDVLSDSEESKVHNLLLEDLLTSIASVTHGFVGADLAALAKEAAMIVLRRVLPDLNLEEDKEIPRELLDKLRLTAEDFKQALKVVRPSAMREVLIESPNVKWTHIGGLEEAKQELIEAIDWPLKYAESFTRLGVKPPKGVLLYGAPGTGKTLLAKAIATESEANFILIKGPELLSKWVGESEKAVREIFKKARQTSPTIIFFDEIDSIAPKRSESSDSRVTERVVNQLLTEMDGLQELEDVVIIAATNRPDMLDTALLRSGRFDRIILINSPDKKSRQAIFEVHTKGMPLAKDVNIKKLVDMTEGYVGADIESICREAAMLSLRVDLKSKEIQLKFFEDAIKKVRPSVTKEISEEYEKLQDRFSSAKAREMTDEKPSYYG
ncbi:MAG: CDC48 family AAA ATPase [Nanoarchaeota archaeon]|nr:CDC48 family AAA ATPase [Nanoarchaeota archaeon]